MRLLVAILQFVVMLFAGATVQAQDFPTKPIRLVVPGPPGQTPNAIVAKLSAAMAQVLAEPATSSSPTSKAPS